MALNMKQKIWYYFALPVPLLWFWTLDLCHSALNFKMIGPGGGGEGYFLIGLIMVSLSFSFFWTLFVFLSRPEKINFKIIRREILFFYGIATSLVVASYYKEEILQVIDNVNAGIDAIKNPGKSDPSVDGLDPKLKKMIVIDRLINRSEK